MRIYSQALLWNSASCRRRVRALRSLSDLSLALSSNATTLNHLIRLRGSQGIQIWKQRTAVTLDTVADESRKKTANGVARSPSRFCSRDGKICCYGDTLSTIFLLACFCALLPTFRFSFFILIFLFFSCIPDVYLLRVPPSVQQPSATLSKYVFYIVRILFACVICTLPHLGIILLFLFILGLFGFS